MRIDTEGRRSRRVSGFRSFLVFSALVANLVQAADWPQRRGPAFDGTTTESSGFRGVPWPAGPSRWTGAFGAGASSPIVIQGTLYAFGWSEGRDRVAAVDAADGKPRWVQSYEAPEYGRHSDGDKGLYSGPSSTPVFDPETKYLYTLGADGQLRCWDAAEEGRLVWSVGLYERFRATQRPKVGRSGLRDYGYTSSPLVHAGWLLVEIGAPQGNLVALDKRTGEPRWFSANRDPAGHTAGPVPIDVDGIPAVVVLTHRRLLVVRLDAEHEGATLGEYAWETDFANNVVTPTVRGTSVLLTSGYNQSRIVRLKVSATGVTKQWEQPLYSQIATPVVLGAYACWSWQQVQCVDYETGKPRWSGGKFGDAGSLIATADGRLVVWGGRGKLALVEGPARSPRAYRELALREAVLPDDAWPHAALAERRLYLKDRRGALACFDLGATAER